MARYTAQMFSLFGFANLLLARRWLCDADSQIANPVISGLNCVIFCITFLIFGFQDLQKIQCMVIKQQMGKDFQGADH